MNNENQLNNSEIDTVNVTWDADGGYACGCKFWSAGLSGQHIIWELCNKHFQIMHHMARIESCDFGINRVRYNYDSERNKTELKQELDF